ncbi:MAG: hypothetical protein LC750_07615 [Actinobacteria bacterium]|nr:hypothetical protein [Actinomycetota bacterium]
MVPVFLVLYVVASVAAAFLVRALIRESRRIERLTVAPRPRSTTVRVVRPSAVPFDWSKDGTA